MMKIRTKIKDLCSNEILEQKINFLSRLIFTHLIFNIIDLTSLGIYMHNNASKKLPEVIDVFILTYWFVNFAINFVFNIIGSYDMAQIIKEEIENALTYVSKYYIYGKEVCLISGAFMSILQLIQGLTEDTQITFFEIMNFIKIIPIIYVYGYRCYILTKKCGKDKDADITQSEIPDLTDVILNNITNKKVKKIAEKPIKIMMKNMDQPTNAGALAHSSMQSIDK
jgi:hypothetical protein